VWPFVRTDVSLERNFFRSGIQLLATANVVPNPLILFTLMTEATSSSETSGLTRITQRHIPEAGIIQENPRQASPFPRHNSTLPPEEGSLPACCFDME
jgi:hypothetical protein